MIPVKPQPQPLHFNDRVKIPGTKFLRRVPKPNTKQWEGKEYWQRVLPDMRQAYNSICAYSAHWIPHSTGNHSVDHFRPKSQDPNLAYQWSNFRYVATRFNSRKGTRAILDPFTLLPHWFIIDFKSLLVKPNPNLSAEQKEAVRHTIKNLKLNKDEALVDERWSWFKDFLENQISWAHLKKRAPFIASELERQGLLAKGNNSNGYSL